MRPPRPFMVWFPVLVLIIFFLANVIVSLFTRRYAYTANILFHAAFIIVAVGVGVSLLYRFEGTAVLTEGDVFWGEKGDYINYSTARGIPIIRVIKKALVGDSKDNFDRLAPKLSFKLDKIIPEYWGEKLHFTRLDGEIRYPAETLADQGAIRLNGGLTINGARIRHSGFGFAPEILLEDIKSGAIRRHTAVMRLFPPGSEDYIELGSYKIYMQVFSDPITGKGRLWNRSMNLVNPIFRVKVTWLDHPIYEGVLKKGEMVRLGATNISLTGVKYWLAIEIVKDPGETIVIIGLITMATGLLLRLFQREST